MTFPLVFATIATLLTLLLAVLVFAAVPAARRGGRLFWRRTLLLHALLLVLHLFATFPVVLGWFGSRGLSTRHDERAYSGPRFDGSGGWLPQDRSTLQAPPPSGSTAVPALQIPGADGVLLRAFRVPARREPPRAMVILVHGLFRNALEIEAPAAMFWRQGCEVWLVEQRNHGGSSRAPATFGRSESRDLIAVVQHIHGRYGARAGGPPFVLFGVSLGAVAVALALPELPQVAAAVLDAPIDDLTAGAHRMLGLVRPGDRRSWFALDEPWRSLVLAAVENWSSFRLRDVRPAVVLGGLRADLPILLIGGGDDDKAPPETVQAIHDALPMPPGVKELWLQPGAGHGDVWKLAPAAYEQHLADLLRRATAQ